MSKKIFLIALFASVSFVLYSQRSTLDLTFTAVNNIAYVQLESIKIMNRTRGGDTILYYPDTVLSIYDVGIPDISKGDNAFQVFQNYPNPVADQTTISLYVPDKDRVDLIVTDILGRLILQSDRVLDKGIHNFRFTPGGANLYFFTARWRGNSSSIKILQSGVYSGGTTTLEYTDCEDSSPQLKVSKAIQDFFYSPGDELLYMGYANGFESGMLDVPEESQTYTFQFTTNIPCPGTPIVEYEGQIYNTIQVFSQCWLKENLNVGTMITRTMEQSNNGTIEKYCYYNEPDSCAKYGGLYQWDEMMQYTTQQGVQGICPLGWHLPTDEEWKVLEGAVDSQYGIGDNIWDYLGHRGYEAWTNLKTTSGWNNDGNGTDLFGFSGLPGGYLLSDGSFYNVGFTGCWWTSTELDDIYKFELSRVLICDIPGVYRNAHYGEYGFSVRCLRDY